MDYSKQQKHILLPENVCFVLEDPLKGIYPQLAYMLKANNRTTRTRCEICSKLTVKTPERRWHGSGVFIVNLKHISHLALMFLLSTFNLKFQAGPAFKSEVFLIKYVYVLERWVAGLANWKKILNIWLRDLRVDKLEGSSKCLLISWNFLKEK